MRRLVFPAFHGWQRTQVDHWGYISGEYREILSRRQLLIRTTEKRLFCVSLRPTVCRFCNPLADRARDE
jgi:hypothetical protein